MADKMTTTDFVEKAKLKHGDKYDYSEVNYINSRSKVRIVCKEHGVFIQQAANHLFGNGCTDCAGITSYSFESLSEEVNRKYNNEITLVDGQIISGVNKKYKFRHSCGHEWYAWASLILRGKSCPVCAKTRFNPTKPTVFYIFAINYNGNFTFTGFGISNVYKRRKSEHLCTLKASNHTISSEILIHSDGLTIQQLEQYVKRTLQCNNSTIEGFKTESLRIAHQQLLDFCIKWLTANEVSYKLSVNT